MFIAKLGDSYEAYDNVLIYTFTCDQAGLNLIRSLCEQGYLINCAVKQCIKKRKTVLVICEDEEMYQKFKDHVNVVFRVTGGRKI